MSYPSLSGYYNSSAQSSSNANNTNNASGYPSSSRNTNNSMYSSSLNNSSNSTQPTSYNTSGYGWSGQSAYATAAPAEQSNENYQQSSDYGYQRSSAYESQSAPSMNNSYSQDYYSQAPMRQNQQPAHNQTEGLSNLAYASGLESANSRSSTTRNTQPYDMPSSQQQSRMRSPVENQPRYSVNPPAPTSSSYSMRQQQGSSSSASSNQLAMDAAAALAGAVGRRNANNVQHSSLNPPRESSSISNARSTMSSAPRRTASPQISTVSRSHQSYAPTQSQSQSYAPSQSQSQSQSQPQPQQQRQQQQTQTQPQSQQRVPPSPYNTTSSQSTSRQVPPAPVSNVQSQQANTNRGTQHQYSTRSSPRNIRQTGSIAHLVTAAHEAESNADERSHSPEASESAPTFIDPTSIFDPYAQERERRRQAAERAAIEARKQAEEDAKRKAAEDARAEEVRKQNEKEAAAAAERKRLQDEAEAQKKQTAAKFAKSNSASKRKSKETVTPAPPAAQTEEERMAAELKAMMEKMKAFQSKDPSLFKKLWDDMRKPGPIATTTSVDTPSPQLVQQSLPVAVPQPQETVQPEVVTEQPAVKKVTPRRSRKPQMGSDGQPLRLNGYAVVVEDNAEGLPDLGRFPAERRIRDKYARRRTGDNMTDESQVMGQESTSPPATADQPARPVTNVYTPGAATAPTPSKTARATPAALSQAFPPPSTSKSTAASTSVKSSAGTIWPLEKRNALTSTALKALKAIPENASVQITEEDLYKILENNPSYIDLCQQLEAKGLKFHRGHFARELLNSVPDLKGSTPTSHPTPASGAPTGQPVSASTVPPTTPLAQPPSQAVNLYSHPHPPPPVPPYGHVPAPYAPPHYGPPAGQFVQHNYHGFGVLHPPGQNVPVSSYNITPKGGYSGRSQPPPGSKEAAARKRDFSELIDLTELGDDDNYVIPDKHPRLEGPDSGDEMETDPFQAYQKSAPAPHNPPSGFFPPPAQPVQFNPQPGQPAPVQKQESFAELKGQRFLLAKPLNKEEALKKQYYDPKTVARDLLIATGRHPSERPLNVHLAGMLGKYIELDSDVDTFEWDEVDPGGPPIPKVEIGDVPASKPRFKIGQRVHRKGRKSKLLSTSDKTRRPDKENHANGVASPTTQPATDNSTSVISTSKSSLLKDQLRKEAFRKPASKLRHSLLASDEQATPAQFDPTKPPQVQSDHLPGKSASTTKSTMSQESTPRRRPGRPPGSKNKFPSVAGLKAQASDIKVRVNLPHRENTPPTKEKFKCKWKKCSTVLHNLDTLRKHIGRLHRPSSTDATNEGYTCWWKKCKYLKQDENTGDWITTKVFDHWEDWLKHIEKDHVTPIAIRWGDGPATNHVGKHRTPSRS